VTDQQWVIRGARALGGEPTDISIRGGMIAAIGPGVVAPGVHVLDAAGLVALPGLVDLHTHLREPGREDAETVETGTMCTRWRTPTRSRTPPGSPSRYGGSAGRPATATCSRSAR
jgi:hypothetical protein